MKRISLVWFLVSILLVSFSSGFFAFRSVSAKPSIIDWYSSGGHPRYKDDDKDVMYLVEKGDLIEFSVTVDEPANFSWEVNKIEQNETSNRFTFSVPEEDGIYEIHVTAYNEFGESHHEWVISTLSEEEAPDIFDYFTDKKSFNRSMTDPWNRTLPEWSGGSEYAPHVSKGFVDSSEGETWASISSSIAYGTWRFKYRFPEAMERCGGEGFGFTYIRAYGENWGSYSFSQCCDSHHHCVISHSEAEFSIDYDDGVVLRDNWYTVTIIRTRDGWIYMFRDDRIEFLAHDNKVNTSESIFLSIVGPDSPKRYFDCLEVYADKYLFPNKGIFYGEYVSNYYCQNYKSYPIKKSGIIVRGRNATLAKIADAINNPSLFTYNPVTRTADCYTNLVVDEGAQLSLKNEKIRFHCSYDGELEFVLKYASEISIENSVLTSANEHYWVWNIAGSSTHYGYEIKLDEGRNPGYYDFVMVLAGSYHGRFRVMNSVINNTAHMFFDSPYELKIEDTDILNLHEVDLGNYTFMGSYEDAVKDMRTFVAGRKGFWIYTDDMNLDDFTLRNIRFSEADQPLNLTFMINAHRDKLALYNINAENSYFVIKESLAETYRQSHDCYSNGPPYNWKSYLDSGISLVNCLFNDVLLTPHLFTDCDGKYVKKYAAVKYYLDVKVVDANGDPVPNATVIVTNEIDNANFPAENLEVAKYFTGDLDAVDAGEYCGFYHHFRIVEGLPLNCTFTGADGHTPLPSDKERTIVVTDYVKKMEDAFDAIRLSWVSHQGYVKYILFEVYDELHGNILHKIKSFDLKSGDWFHVEVSYNSSKQTVRLIMTDKEGMVVWDTGEIKLMTKIDPFNFNQLVFETRKKDATNDISWDGDHIKIDTSVYRGHILAHFDNNTIITNGRTIESNDYSADPGLVPIDENVMEYYNLSDSTGGESFTWDFDLKLDDFDVDGPRFDIWLRDSNHTVSNEVKMINYTYNITVVKDGKKAVVENFDIDKEWYREYPDFPTRTLVVNLDTGEWWIESSVGGNLTGTVEDEYGSPISGAEVSIGMKTTATNLTGGYIFTNLPPGNYTVTVSKSGYIPQFKTVEVKENQTTIANFVLARDSNPPSISNVHHQPEIVQPNQQVTVYSDITDAESGVAYALLSYSADDGISWHNITMNPIDETTYEGTIPGFPAGTKVIYKIIAYDNAGNTALDANNGEYYVYMVVQEFPNVLMLLLLLIAVTAVVVLVFTLTIRRRRDGYK